MMVNTASARVPLVVDLDGTLHAEDLSWLLFVHAARHNPFIVLQALFTWLLRGKAAMKDLCGKKCRLSLDRLCWHGDVLSFIRQAKAEGVPLVLATGTPQHWAEACNRYLGAPFDRVLGSDLQTNLIGKAKAQALVSAYGVQGFDYIGNSGQDLHVWPCCRNILIANAPARVEEKARAIDRPVTKVFAGTVCKQTTPFTNVGSGDVDR
ncbi:MAG: haloacid dehalogenase-like hydrolase [Exilibacterium sp.]